MLERWHGTMLAVWDGAQPVGVVTMVRFNGVAGSVRRSSTARWVVVAVGAVMVLMGGIFGAVAYDNYRDGEATKAWPSTSGQILTANVDEEERRDRDSDGRIRTRYTYTPRISYAYTIQGVEYTGHRIRADDSGGDRDKAFDTINDFPVGSIVNVYYDPSDPGSSVLKQGADPVAVWVFGGVGGVFMILGLVGVVGTTVLRRGV
jgi:hypothetical protein